MPSRIYSSATYRYGFNGQENEVEVYGSGSLTTADFWEYDTRLGRRWNMDPIVKFWESPYNSLGDNPIFFADPTGADKDYTMSNGQTGTVGDNADVSSDGQVIRYPNGSTATWDKDHYEPVKSTEINHDPKLETEYIVGSLWETDNGQQAIFPRNQGSLPSGWNYLGTGIYKTEGRTNMIQLEAKYPGTFQLFMPRVNLVQQLEKAQRDGGRDAVIALSVSIAAPFAIVYGPTILTIANEKIIEYYFVTNIALNNLRNRAVSNIITFLVRRFGAAALPAIHYLQKYGDKMDPMLLRNILEAIVKKLAGSEATRGMTPTNYYMVPGAPTDPPVPNANSK